MKVMTMVEALNDALRTEMKRDENVIIFGEDVGVEGGVFRVTVNLQKEFGEERCFDSPLAEGAISGAALGMAIAGMKPVVEMQFSGFAWTAFNQVINHISRIRNRTRGSLTAPLVIRMPYGGGIRALEHHSESMEAIWGHIPGLKVVIPSTPYDAKGLLISAMRDPDPVIFMEPKRLYRSVKQEIPEDAYTIPIGRGKLITQGTDITVVSYGAQMKEAQAAAGQLKKQEIDTELIDLRTIYPYDLDLILDSVKKTGRLLVVHEGPQTFGVGAEIITAVTEQAFLHLEAPPSRVTGADTVFPLPRGESHYMISTERIMNAVKTVVTFKP